MIRLSNDSNIKHLYKMNYYDVGLLTSFLLLGCFEITNKATQLFKLKYLGSTSSIPLFLTILLA